MKTARFTELVKKAGAPETYLLWVPPKEDSMFQRAVKEHRILTIHQENVGTKKDYGLVGFHEEPNAQFLMFQKSLKNFLDRRIVGINYDLLAKDSRAGKPPAIERRVPKSKAAKQEKLKAATNKKADATTVQSESDATILAFETAETPVRSKPPKAPPRQTKESTAPKQPKPPKEPKPPKQPKPLNPSKPAKETGSRNSSGSTRNVDTRVLAVVRRAMKDLDAGKTVAAYKRLEALVAEAKEGGG